MPESVTAIIWTAAGILGVVLALVLAVWGYVVFCTQPIRSDRHPEGDDAWGM